MPIDIVALRTRAGQAAGRMADDPRGCAAGVRRVFQDFADHSRRPGQRPVGARPDYFLRTPRPVIREVAAALRGPIQAHPAAAAELVQVLWAAGTTEERRLAAEVLGTLAAHQPDQALTLLEALLPRSESAETVDALSAAVFKPLVLRDPGRFLPLAQRWANQPNKWLRRAAASSVVALTEERRWGDLPAALDVLRVMIGEGDPSVRPAVIDALRILATRRPLDVRPFLTDQAKRPDHHSRYMVRAVLKALPDDWQDELVQVMRG